MKEAESMESIEQDLHARQHDKGFVYCFILFHLNNKITEMKNTLEEINSRINEAEERITNLEDRMVEFTAAEQNKEKRMKRNEDSLIDLWDNIKCNNIQIIGVPEEEEKKERV